MAKEDLVMTMKVQAVREANAQGEDLRLLVDGILDYGILMVDVDGTILTWNAGARRIYGYAPSEIIGKHFSVFYTDAERAAGKPGADLAIARNERRFEKEGWRMRQDGTAFWATVVLAPLYDEAGELRAFGKVTRDLSERRDADARYRLLVESVRDYAIITLDREGVVQTWNVGAERIKGYSAAEIIGQNFRRFYTAADISRDYPTTELLRAEADGRYEDEGWRVRKDGTMFWANVVITALRDPLGGVIGFSKVTRDLTERRLVEQQLQESEERFRLMVASVKEYAIIMLDPDGIIISWNAGAERIKGWCASEIIGSSFERLYPPEDVAAGKTAGELREATDTGACEDNGWRVRKDGTRFWANVVITALRDATGTLRGFAKVTRDETERRDGDQRLRKAYDELESFSYSVAHDLRAPLRSMDAFSDELVTRYTDKLDDRGKDYLGRIRASAKRMARLIDDLLNLARLGRAKLVRAPIDLSEIARKTAEALQRADPSRKVEFVIAATMIVRADAALMRVVLSNLIGNAWKYTSHHPTARIEVGVAADHGASTFYVRDDGAGFDMQHASKLFGAFQRLHSNEEFPGTGIGLATVKRIIECHGGEVSASGAIEMGSTFTFSVGS